MPATTTRIAALADLVPADLKRWRELADGAPDPNPFYDPHYVLPLHAALGGNSRLHLLTVTQGSEWLACLPVAAGRWRGRPAPACSSWRPHPLYSLLGNPLLAPGEAAAGLDGVVRGMMRPRGAAFAALEWVSGDGPVAAAAAEVLRARAPRVLEFETFERAAVWRRPENTYIEETLSSKHRREIRRQRRKLGEALDATPETVELAGQDDAYGRLIELEAAGRKGAKGTVLASDEAHAAFFRSVCRAFADRGALQMLALRVGENTIAMKCNLLAGDTTFCLKIAFDEEFASFSPGIQLEVDALKLFHEEPIAKIMDSCADPHNAMINRLWPDRRRITSYLVPSPGPAGVVVAPILRAARSARNRRDERRSP